MPGHDEAVLRQFNHNTPLCPKYQPATHVPPTYNAIIQQPIPPNEFPRLGAKVFRRVQKVVLCLLFNVIAINLTMFIALGDLALSQFTSTKHTTKALRKIFNYTPNPDTEITFKKRDVILYIDSNELYLFVSKCKSRAGVFII